MKRLLLAFTSVAALWSAACGGSGGGAVTPPPPVGKFSNSSLNGTYAFVTNGEVATSSGETNLMRTGSFVANGQGGITGGIEDVVVPGVGQTLGISINSTSSYSINANGTGAISLNVTSAGVPSTLTFGITLTSTTGGLLIDETFTQSQASTGSGNFFLQNAADCSSANPGTLVSGNYIFDFSGVDPSGAPESLVGQFTAGNGVITTGITDANDGGTLSSGAIGAGSFGSDPQIAAGPDSCGRGQATIGGQTYEYYIVDSTRIRFISINTGAVLTGDAFVQTNALPASASALNSSFAFLVAGTDNSGNSFFITRAGRFSTNGTTVTNALVDTNDGGNEGGKFTVTTVANPSNASVTYDPSTGRGTVTFKDPNLAVPFSFVFYLSSATQGVIQETTESNVVALAVDVADGTLGGQTGTPFSSSNITGTYAMNWTGLSVQAGITDEEDLIGQSTISSLALSGSADIYQFAGSLQNGTGPQTGNTVSGTISLGGDGTGGSLSRNTMAVTLTKGSSVTVNCVVYFVNPQLAFFTNTSASQNRDIAGILQLQP